MKSGIYEFECPKCGFGFSCGIPEVDQKELDDIRACPCGAQMKIVRYVPDEDAREVNHAE
jgi:hypothetical protein